MPDNVSRHTSRLPVQITQPEIEGEHKEEMETLLMTTLSTLGMVFVRGIPLTFFTITGHRIIQ